MSTETSPAQLASQPHWAGLKGVRRPRVAFKPGRVLLYLVLVAAALAMIFPFIWMLLTSLKPEADVVRYPPQLWPRHWSFASYTGIWGRIPFARFFINTVVFAGSVTALSLTLDSLTAYALARLRFPGRDAIFLLILALLMVPFQVTLIPLFNLVFHLGWLNTYQGLIVPRATNAFGIFMLRQFFITVPRELDEAARIDGAGEFGIYWRVVLPLSKSALVTLAVFHFMYNWNDFLWPLIISTSSDMETLPSGLALFMGEHVVEYSLLMAGAAMALAPLIIAFLCAQRYFVAGITMGAVKE
jgi:multiple sugar transport system permease protein